jgi:hypothetical protein
MDLSIVKRHVAEVEEGGAIKENVGDDIEVLAKAKD